MNQDESCTYRCSYCGELNEVSVDVSAGKNQVFVEDCSVCCRPNVLKLRIDPSSDSIVIEAEFEG